MTGRRSLTSLREVVFARDDFSCRICAALGHHQITGQPSLELAHLKARGMGGNPSGTRNVSSNCICCCRLHHQGPMSLHSGHIKWQALTDHGADGPLAFTVYEKLPKAEGRLLA